MEINKLWQAVLGEIELTISKPNFNTWFKNTFIISKEDGEVVVGVPNAFTKAWFENKYHQIILKALNNVMDNSVSNIYYKVELTKPKENNDTENLKNEIINKTLHQTSSQHIEPTSCNKYGLNPNNTFDKFIVGSFNELAHAAAQAVCQKPGKVYNPLFIYGGSGLGKTHLLQAIGNLLTQKFPQINLLYTTCENFTNEFVQSIKQNKIKEFQQKYRNLDVFIIDDIQFMSKKEQTQEQFFHTYNDLKQADKQIIVASDRTPRAIPSIEQRLLTRLEWGMVADISEPDLESRVAIIEFKLNQKNPKINLGHEVVNYLSENIQNNIREMEGILNRIIAESTLRQANLDLERVKELVNSVNIKPKRGALTSKQIIEVVSTFYDVELAEMTGNSRKKELVVPRQIIMFIMREMGGFSFPNIGRELGNRDHTTAMHAHSKVKKLIEKNDKIKEDIDLIKQKFYEI